MKGDFLTVPDLGRDGLTQVLDLAAEVKLEPERFVGRLAGKRIGLFFEKPSTRTRVSTEVATADLGAHPVVLKQDEVGLGTREAVEDVARVLDRYLDVLALRVFDHQDLESLAHFADAPVVNLLSDESHPCQALADLQTIREVKELRGLVLTYVGDGNNVAHSLLRAGALAEMEVRIASPPGFEPATDIVATARELAGSEDRIVVGRDAPELLSGADVVYTDVWASMGQESEASDRKALFAPYQINRDLFELARPDAIFLHCLPAHRGEEVTAEVMEHDRSRVFDQAENRLHSFKALLLYLTAKA